MGIIIDTAVTNKFKNSNMCQKDRLNKIISCLSENIDAVTKTVIDGGVIVFPTDTVYGLGCNPYNKMAVRRIYKIKQRAKEKPFPILAFSRKDIHRIAEFNDSAEKISDKFWPGKVTLVLRLKDQRLRASLGINHKIAVRIPSNSCALSILEKCGLLVGTSANRSGIRSFIRSKDCLEDISGYDIFVDSGTIKSCGESTIVDCTRDDIAILREGAVKYEEIMEAL